MFSVIYDYDRYIEYGGAHREREIKFGLLNLFCDLYRYQLRFELFTSQVFLLISFEKYSNQLRFKNNLWM